MAEVEPSEDQRQTPSVRPLRVCILNQPFHPDVVATAQIAKDLADALTDRGHHVVAVASRSIYGRSGAALPRLEAFDGVEIHRVGAARFGRRSTLGRMLDFAGYYIRALGKGLRLKRFDVVICLTTPPYIALVGLLIRRLRGGRVVYWLMDVYPDVMVAHGMLREGSLLHRLLRRLHHFALRRVDATIALGRCMRDRLLAQGAPPERVHVVPVWPVAESPAASNPADRNPYRQEWGVDDPAPEQTVPPATPSPVSHEHGGERMLVMYSGNFGLAHDVHTFLDAARRLREEDAIRFAFVGGGKRKAEVEAFVREHDLPNCIVADYQPRQRLGDLLAAADVHLVSMIPAWSGLVSPSKFYGAAGVGRPVVFIGPADSEIARTIEETGCGERVEPGDSEGLARLLRDLAADPDRRHRMGEAGARLASTTVSRAACTARIAAIVEGAEGAENNVENPGDDADSPVPGAPIGSASP